MMDYYSLMIVNDYCNNTERRDNARYDHPLFSESSEKSGTFTRPLFSEDSEKSRQYDNQ